MLGYLYGDVISHEHCSFVTLGICLLFYIVCGNISSLSVINIEIL